MKSIIVKIKDWWMAQPEFIKGVIAGAASVAVLHVVLGLIFG